MNKDKLEALREASNAFCEAMEALAVEEEQFWTTLTPEQQLMTFCAVVRRIVKGELDDRRSYRGVLYDTFGFGLESYSRAQNAGFLDLHNCIYDSDYENSLLKEFAEFLGEKNPQEKIYEFYDYKRISR